MNLSIFGEQRAFKVAFSLAPRKRAGRDCERVAPLSGRFFPVKLANTFSKTLL